MKRFLFLIGCFFSTIATASNWQLAYVTDDGSTLFYDLESLTYPSDNKVQVWLALVLSSDEVDSNSSRKFNVIVDTKKRMFQDLQHTIYEGAELVRELRASPKWKHIVPSTNAATLYKLVTTKYVSDPKGIDGSFADLVTFGRKVAQVLLTDEKLQKEKTASPLDFKPKRGDV